MKKFFSGGLFMVLAVAALQANAQNSGYARGKTTPKDTTVKQPAATNPTGNKQPANVPATTVNNATGSATVRYDTTNPGGFDQRPEISLRNNYAVDRSQVKDRKPLEYEHLRDDDNLWSEFIWREIDAREKANQSFMYPGKDDNGD
ncbi:MAG: gliding motility protein GldN, partial [Sediminibacterium sp.]|nr:gliding motility protein GldN [Sediminibacterium sp.]